MVHARYPLRRFAPALALALAAILAVAASAPPATAEAQTRVAPADFFGVGASDMRSLVGPADAGRLDGLASSMSEQGIGWARITFAQNIEEPRDGVFNWYSPDTMVAALARHGVRAVGAFIGTAAWAAHPAVWGNCGPRSYPHDVDGWSDWVAAAADRYGTGGSFWAAHPELPRLPVKRWVIGNEVNSALFWCPAADPEHYATVYSAAADALAGADPAAEALAGALAPRFGWSNEVDLDVPTFLERMTAAEPELRSRIPSLSVHPYAQTPEGVVGVVAEFREAAEGAGLGATPMLADEVGWHTNGPPGPLLATEAQRANRIAAVADRLWRLDCNVEGLAPYSWVSQQQNPETRNDWFGLTDAATGDPLQSGLAYGEQIRIARGLAAQPPPQQTLDCTPLRTLNLIRQGGGMVTSSPAGIGCGGVCEMTVADGAHVTLSATPAQGYSFSSWSGCTSTSGAQCTVTMDAAKTVTATFAPIRTVAVSKVGSGNVSSTPAGINCGAICLMDVVDGLQLLLTATPAHGGAFLGWVGCAIPVGNVCVLAVNTGMAVTAVFRQLHTLTLIRQGGGAVTSSPAGIGCGGVCAMTVADSTQVTLSATPAPGYAFRSWSGCSNPAGAQCTVTMDAARTVTVTFVPIWTLAVSKAGSGNVSSAPAGINCGASCLMSAEDGAEVVLTATPAAGGGFTGWSGCPSPQANRCTVPMNASRNVTAHFVPLRTLTVIKQGGGTVTSSPAGISCGGACGLTVSDGTQVALSATPAAGYVFRSWSGCTSAAGAQCTVTMDAAKTVTASFAPIWTLAVSKVGSGNVSSAPAGINCGASCLMTAPDGDQVVLTATPAPGHAFQSWSGCPSPQGNRCTVPMSVSRNVTAGFRQLQQFSVQVRSTGGTVTSAPAAINCGQTCAAMLQEGTALTLSATPSPGYRFQGWSGCASPNGSSCPITVAADASIAASFTPTAAPITRAAAPETTIAAPRVRKRARSATLSIAASGGTGAFTFSCRMDAAAFAPCGATRTYKLRRGRHTFEAIAIDELGRADTTPARRTFRIRR